MTHAEMLLLYPWDEEMGCYARKFGGRGLIIIMQPGTEEAQEGWHWIAAFRSNLTEANGFATVWEAIADVEERHRDRIARAER